jgi:hypothetical protein
MLESNRLQAVGFIERVRRSAISSGKIAVVMSLIDIALFPIHSKLYEADPCSRSVLRLAVEWTGVVSIIAGLGLAVYAVLAGLLTLRVLAIGWGLVSFLVFYTELEVDLRSDKTMKMDVFAVAQLRTINTAEVLYRAQASSFGSIEDLIRVGELENPFTSAVDGYNFTVFADKNEYTAKATSASRYGCWDYFTSADARIRYSTDQSRAPKGKSAQVVE